MDKTNSVRLPELDGLRGLAILLVVICHYVDGVLAANHSWLAKFIRPIFALSWSGVDLFFVLSGFLIGGILMDYRHSENYYRVFYLRRISRTFPLYFLWVAITLGFVSLFTPAPGKDWQKSLVDLQGFPGWSYLLFLQNFYCRTKVMGAAWLVTTWSLVVEEQFYLILPFLVKNFTSRRQPCLFVLFICLAPAFRLYLYYFNPAAFVYVLLACRMDALFIGVLCAWLLRHEPSRNWLVRNRAWLFAALAVFFLGVCRLSVDARTQLALTHSSFAFLSSFTMISWGYTWLAMFYAVLLLAVVIARQSFVARIMRVSGLRQMGLIAYGVFLIHPVMNALVHGILLGKGVQINNFQDAGATVIAFLATVFLAAVSWHFFENPLSAGDIPSFTLREIPGFCQVIYHRKDFESRVRI